MGPGPGHALFPETFLKGLGGVLPTEADGTGASWIRQTMIHAGGWAHGRRKFHDAFKRDPAAAAAREVWERMGFGWIRSHARRATQRAPPPGGKPCARNRAWRKSARSKRGWWQFARKRCLADNGPKRAAMRCASGRGWKFFWNPGGSNWRPPRQRTCCARGVGAEERAAPRRRKSRAEDRGELERAGHVRAPGAGGAPASHPRRPPPEFPNPETSDGYDGTGNSP